MELFSEDKIALLRETKFHPKLHTELLGYNERTEWPDMLGHIAAYCGIIMDDVYTEADLDKLCGILVWKLKDKVILL